MATPRDLEAAFVEQIAAGATHELRNVLAIVKEAAGLIDDLLQAAKEPGKLDRSKIEWATGRIRAQVDRGTSLVSALNRFAHSLGDTEESLDLRRTVREAALLGQRFVRKRQLQLRVRESDGELIATVNPLRTYMAIMAGVECCAEQLSTGDAVVLGAEVWEGDPAVRFTAEGAGAVPVRTDAARMTLCLGGFGTMSSPLFVDDGDGGFLLVFPVERL